MVPRKLEKDRHVRGDTYASLLGTIAQVTGVFLGLYFTAVSAVASGAYAKVPNTVRTLVLEEKVGNLYVRLLAFEAALATLLLGGHALGLFLGYLNLAVVLSGAIFSIFAFVVLGFRIFYFFDAALLVGYVERDLRTAIVAIATGRRRSMVGPLQMEYHRRAQSSLSSYNDLVVVATQQGNVEAEALVQLSVSLCRSLRFYCEHKNRIPSDSYWFTREYGHPDWFSADYSALSVALQTGTSLQPKEFPDLRWCEKKIAELLDRLIAALDRCNDWQALTRVIVRISECMNSIGRIAPEDALDVFDAVAPTFFKGQPAAVPTGSDPVRDGRYILSLATAQSQIPIAILLGFAQYCEHLNQSSFGAAIKSINWRELRSIYRSWFPRLVTKEMESLWSEVNAERKIEGTFVLSEWFVLEHANRNLAEFLANCSARFVNLLDSFFIKACQATPSYDPNLVCAPILQGALEYCDKLAYHLSSARSRFKEITSAPSLEEIPWPSDNWDALIARIALARETLLTILAGLARDLGALPVENYPDYFGQLYSVLAQECYQSLVQSDERRFSKLFPRFFEIAFVGSQRIRKQIGSADAKAILMSDPINDLLELSGFALIYSELDGKPVFADTMRNLWDTYVSNFAEPERTQRLNAFASWPQILLRTTPRDMVRMG